MFFLLFVLYPLPSFLFGGVGSGAVNNYSTPNGFLSLEIEGDYKIVIVCYNKRISVPLFYKILMEDIWKLSRDLSIYSYHHVYRETNRIADCLAKKGIDIIDLRTLRSNFPKDLQIVVLKITVDRLLIVFARLRHCSFALTKKKKKNPKWL